MRMQRFPYERTLSASLSSWAKGRSLGRPKTSVILHMPAGEDAPDPAAPDAKQARIEAGLVLSYIIPVAIFCVPGKAPVEAAGAPSGLGGLGSYAPVPHEGGQIGALDVPSQAVIRSDSEDEVESSEDEAT